MNDPITFF